MTDEERVQYDMALHRDMLNWHRKHVLEQFKRPRKLKHVRQPTPSRVSHLRTRVLDKLEIIQKPTQSRMSMLKLQALNQLTNNPIHLKQINPPIAIQQHQIRADHLEK